MPSLRQVLFLEEDKKLCSTYEGCVIPLHECLFSKICLTLPFNDFNVGFFNLGGVAPSQLHPIS